jgi:hypothetical protein
MIGAEDIAGAVDEIEMGHRGAGLAALIPVYTPLNEFIQFCSDPGKNG